MSYKYSSLCLSYVAVILSFVIFLPVHTFAQNLPPIPDSVDELSPSSDSATQADTSINSTEYLKLQKEISQIKIELGKKRNTSEPFSILSSFLQYGSYALVVLIYVSICRLWLLIRDLDSKTNTTINRIGQSFVTLKNKLDPLHSSFILDQPNKAINETNSRISSTNQQLDFLSKRIADVVYLTSIKPPSPSPISAPSASSFFEQKYVPPASLKQPESLSLSLHQQVIDAFGKSQILFDSPQFHAVRDANAQNGRVNEEGVKALELIPAQRPEAAYLLFSDNNDDWLIPNVFHSRLTQQISQMKVENSNIFDVDAIVGLLVLVRAAKVQKFNGNEYRVLVKGLIHC